MFVLLAILAIGFFAYMVWRWNASGLRRECRWRQSRSEGGWTCTYCGGHVAGEARPNICIRDL